MLLPYRTFNAHKPVRIAGRHCSSAPDERPSPIAKLSPARILSARGVSVLLAQMNSKNLRREELLSLLGRLPKLFSFLEMVYLSGRKRERPTNTDSK